MAKNTLDLEKHTVEKVWWNKYDTIFNLLKKLRSFFALRKLK